jgi:hypothetical protein
MSAAKSQDNSSDPDILRAAQYMIERHGASAALHAGERAMQLTRDHQHDAALIWLGIAKAIRTLHGSAE